eukprot:GHVN01075266.1.p1 GENE.GHVN01075266.1~~GHVN01075266.1.p1  ORF type:complete len:166 (-),score=50.85 GHVN01075266.1:205-702(-)
MKSCLAKSGADVVLTPMSSVSVSCIIDLMELFVCSEDESKGTSKVEVCLDSVESQTSELLDLDELASQSPSQTPHAGAGERRALLICSKRLFALYPPLPRYKRSSHLQLNQINVKQRIPEHMKKIDIKSLSHLTHRTHLTDLTHFTRLTHVTHLIASLTSISWLI